MRDKRFSDRWVVLLRFSISPEPVMVRSPLSTSSPWNGVNLEKECNNALFLEFSSLHFVFKYSLAAVYLLQAAEMRVNLGKMPLWPVYHCRKEREAYLFNINLVNNMFYVVFATSGGKTFHNIAHCLDIKLLWHKIRQSLALVCND